MKREDLVMLLASLVQRVFCLALVVYLSYLAFARLKQWDERIMTLPAKSSSVEQQ